MKKLLRLFLFTSILLSFAFLSKSSIFAAAPLCQTICPPGTYSAGQPPGFGYGNGVCNSATVGSSAAIYCSYSGSQCTNPLPMPPNCTGIVLNQIPNATVYEGSPYTYSGGYFTDQFSGPSATVDYGDGTGAQSLILSGNNFSLNHTYQNIGVYTVTVTISDAQGMPVASVSQVSVVNVAPTVGSVTVNNSTVVVNTVITASAAFTDLGSADTHTAVWDWGDGAVTTGTVTETNGSGSVSGSHSYTVSGAYTVKLTVTDEYGASGTATYQYITVYAPTSSSYLLGGGLLNLAPGTLSPSGKLAFGIAVGYSHGSQTPSGATVIVSTDLKFNFVVTAYQWLVVSGNTAFLQATGKVNGSGNYTLLLTALQSPQSGGTNMIRLQINNSSTNTVFYDSQPGSPIYAAPTTPVANGFITVHN